MLNLRVAAERAEVAKLDRRIVATQQSIRALQTEVGTRSRIPQLEEWNEDVLALAAPASGQYVQQNVSLARFDTRQPQVADQSDVRLASADVPPQPAIPGEPASATPAPQRAVGAASPVGTAPQVRRASLLIAPEGPAKARDAVERPRREADRLVRVAARDEVHPGPREARARPAARDDRAREERMRPGPRDERRAAPVRTASREERRPTPALATARAAAAPGAAGRILANQRSPRELRKDERPERRRSARD
jgi:hypothetical protein